MQNIGKNKAYLLFLLPSMAGVTVFVLLPFFDVIRRSFTSVVTGEFRGISNYQMIFKTPAFLLAVKNTLRFTVVCIPLLIIIALLFAIYISRMKRVGGLKALFLIPMAIPTATVVLIWKMVFYKQGFLNLFLMKLAEILNIQWNINGLTAPDYMGSSAAFWVLVFSYIWKNLGYTIILWLAGIMSIPTDICEAARVDGAGEWKCFWRVIMPNLKGSLYTIAVLSFLNSFKVFREAYLVAGSYPDKSMYLMQHLFNNWFVNLDLDKMAAAAVCVGGVLILFILLLQKLWDEKEEEAE